MYSWDRHHHVLKTLRTSRFAHNAKRSRSSAFYVIFQFSKAVGKDRTDFLSTKRRTKNPDAILPKLKSAHMYRKCTAKKNVRFVGGTRRRC